MKALLVFISILLFSQSSVQAYWVYGPVLPYGYSYNYYYWWNPDWRQNYLDLKINQARLEEVKQYSDEIKIARMKNKWAYEDAKKARDEQNNYLHQWEKKLDDAEKKYALQQRENDLIEKGILPKPPERGGFKHKGVFFKSVSEFMEHPLYQELLDERIVNELVELKKKEISDYKHEKYMQTLRGYIPQYRDTYSMYRGQIVNNRSPQWQPEMPELDAFTQYRRSQELNNNPEAFNKKFGTSYQEWYEYRNSIKNGTPHKWKTVPESSE